MNPEPWSPKVCPSCGDEYRPEIDRCADCGDELVHASEMPEATAPGPGDGGEELVAVLRTSDSTLLPLVESILEAEGIPYVVQGGGSMGLFPLGAAGSKVARTALDAVIHVAASDAATVRELLGDVTEDEKP